MRRRHHVDSEHVGGVGSLTGRIRVVVRSAQHAATCTRPQPRRAIALPGGIGATACQGTCAPWHEPKPSRRCGRCARRRRCRWLHMAGRLRSTSSPHVWRQHAPGQGRRFRPSTATSRTCGSLSDQIGSSTPLAVHPRHRQRATPQTIHARYHAASHPLPTSSRGAHRQDGV